MKKYGVNRDICVLKVFVNPSHNSLEKSHEAWIIAKSDGTVITAHCNCKARYVATTRLVAIVRNVIWLNIGWQKVFLLLLPSCLKKWNVLFGWGTHQSHRKLAGGMIGHCASFTFILHVLFFALS